MMFARLRKFVNSVLQRIEMTIRQQDVEIERLEEEIRQQEQELRRLQTRA